MAELLTESKNVHPSSDVKAIINQLRMWSENQRQKFLDKQRIEHQNLFQQSGIKKLEQQINQEHLSENSSGTLVSYGKLLDKTTDRNLSGSDITLQDSSITGHILGCFSDSSLNSPTLSRRKDEITDVDDKVSSKGSNFSSGTLLETNEDTSPNNVAVPTKRPRQPFLKKRSGLLRYFSKQNTNVTQTKKPSSLQSSDSEYLTKPILKLNPVFKINKSPLKTSHVKFIEHDLFIPYKEPYHAKKISENSSESSLMLQEEKDVSSSGEYCSSLERNNPKDENIDCNESLNIEKKELEEFELLENCAQNSSFNSDSSIVRRVLQVEPIQPPEQVIKPRPLFDIGFNFDHLKKPFMDKITGNSEKLNLGNFMEEDRKQHLQDIILDTDLRIASLRKETSDLNKYANSENNFVRERCSTPVDLTNKVNDQLSTKANESESSNDSLSSVIFNPSSDFVTASGTNNSDENGNNINCYKNNEHATCKKTDELADTSDVKAKLCQKMEELEKEIQTYQELISDLRKEKQTYEEHNLRLESIRIERDENLKKLQSGWDELQKHKEEEEKKLKDEKRQLKMREETFNRYQKLRKDNPSRKEREELAVLRQEVEKLQKEIKRQRINFTNENKRLKNQLIAAEQERDCLKLENITLEERCQDLLATYKSRYIKKKPEAGKKFPLKKKETTTLKNHPSSKDSLISSETVAKKSSDSETNDKADANFKPRVRFNLVPQFDSVQGEPLKNNSQTDEENDVGSSNLIGETNEVANEIPDANLSSKEQLPYEEIKHDNQIERIYFSGEKEIIRPSGIIKHISADGETVTFRFPNGDVKEIYPDSSVICKFISGVIEKRFPGGIKVTEHPNGQIEKRSPGLEEVKFPDGTTQTRYIYPDGSEKIEYNDGTKVTIDQDGTEIALFKNGVKEIRTPKYKRKEYPDGSVKIMYEDGSQETRYSNGRVKKKDKDGRILLDTKILQNEFNLSFQESKFS